MFDNFFRSKIDSGLRFFCGHFLKKVSPLQITIVGFIFGISAAALVFFQFYLTGLALMLIGRLMDGLDGVLARLKKETSDRGAFLDIVFDFIFYNSFVAAFASLPENRITSILLLLSFTGTGVSFLAYSALTKKDFSVSQPEKGIYYLEGLTEGSETILFFILICLFPGYFNLLGTIFFILCVITTMTRIYKGFKLL